jgi:hypothetical protein
MSIRSRYNAGGRKRPPLTILTMLAVLLSIGGASLASAQPPPPAAVVLTADAAARAGLVIPLDVTPLMGDAVVQLGLAPAGAGLEAVRRTALRVLSAAPGGSAVAIADRIDDPVGGLTIAQADGSQVRTALPGVAGAAFAPDGSWLAAVDGEGRVWRVDPKGGSASRLADGPFGGALAFARDGALLMIEVASVEAPYASRLVRIAPEGGHVTTVAGIDAPLVLAAQPLSDGSLAAVVHPLGGGIAIRRVTPLGSSLITDLGTSTADVAVSPDGLFVAYGLSDDGVYLVDVARHVTRRLGNGAMPRFAPDASALLVQSDRGSVVIDYDGQTIQTYASPGTAWATCVGGCPS